MSNGFGSLGTIMWLVTREPVVHEVPRDAYFADPGLKYSEQQRDEPQQHQLCVAKSVQTIQKSFKYINSIIKGHK